MFLNFAARVVYIMDSSSRRRWAQDGADSRFSRSGRSKEKYNRNKRSSPSRKKGYNNQKSASRKKRGSHKKGGSYKKRGSQRPPNAYPLSSLDTFRVIVDDRERAVIPYLAEIEGINMKVERITTADYSILYRNGKMIVIERKTWGDLADSIKDHRINNIRDLFRVRDDHDAKIIYLMEGRIPPKVSTKIHGIPFRNLRSKLDHMMIRDGIMVVETRDARQTADRIVQLGVNCSTLDCFSQQVGSQPADPQPAKSTEVDQQVDQQVGKVEPSF